MKVAAFVCVSLVCLGAPRTYLTREQALEKVWGESEVTTSQKSDHTFYSSANSKDKSSASFYTKKVRSKSQTIMVHFAEDGTILDVVLCKFKEPVRYKPSEKWLKQFDGKKLNDDLRLKKDIDGISGATLTARATVSSVRTILAAYHAEE